MRTAVIGTSDDDSEFDRWHALEEKHYHRYLTGELGFLEQRRARIREFVEPLDISLVDDVDADAWYAAYYERYRSAWALHDDVLPCLDALADRRLGLITNGELDFQSAKIDAVGLDGRFEHVVASGAVGVTKPDPRIFSLACSLFGVSPECAVYVGDRLHTDAIGAAAAGLTGVWIDRPGTATPDDLTAASAAGVHVIRSLDEVPGLL